MVIKQTYAVDIDGTICTDTDGKYEKAEPIKKRIFIINRLYDEGHTIIYWTARGGTTGINWRKLTLRQLKAWGCKYHKLIFGKPYYDIQVDDKSQNANTFFQYMDIPYCS